MTFPVRYNRIDTEQIAESKTKKYKLLGWVFMLAFIGLLIGSSQVHDNNVRTMLIILVIISLGLCSWFCSIGHRPKPVSSFDSTEDIV